MESCHTDAYEFEYLWTIKKFSLHLECANKKKGEWHSLNSCSFSIGDENNTTKWSVALYVNGPENKDRDFISFYTKLEDADKKITWAKQDFLIVDSAKNKIKVKSTSMECLKVGNYLDCDEFYEKKKLLENASLYLPNDELTIGCHLTVMGPSTAIPLPNTATPITTTNDLADGYRKLVFRKKFSDVIFIMDGKLDIPAHKPILAARSSVFAAKFLNKIGDEDIIEVKIEGIKYEIFMQILQYIYTNRIFNLDVNAMDFMSAAYEYGLSGLKKTCLEYLCNNIRIDNVLKIFMLAQRHNNQELLKRTRTFLEERILENPSSIHPIEATK